MTESSQNSHIRYGIKYSFIEVEWKNALAAAEIAEKLGDWQSVFQFSKFLGKFLLQKGLWAEREQLNQRAFDVARKVKNSSAEAEALFDLGLVCKMQGQWLKAKGYYTESLGVARQIGDRKGQVKALRHLIRLNHLLRRPQEAEIVHQQLRSLTLQPSIGDHYGSMSYRNATELDTDGQFCEMQGQWVVAAQKYKESLKIRQEAHDSRGQAQSWDHLGRILLRQSKWDESEVAYKKSLQLWQGVGDNFNQAMIIQHLGELYEDQERLEEAEGKYKQCLAMIESNPKAKAVTFSLLGSLYRKQEKWNDSETVLKQSLEISRNLPDLVGQEIALNKLGKLYSQQEQWEKAEKAYKESLLICREQKNLIGEGIAFDRLGDTYHCQKKWRDAEDAYQQGLLATQKANKKDQEGIILINLSRLREEQKDIKGARDFARRAVFVLEKTDDTQVFAEARALLASLERHGESWVTRLATIRQCVNWVLVKLGIQ